MEKTAVESHHYQELADYFISSILSFPGVKCRRMSISPEGFRHMHYLMAALALASCTNKTQRAVGLWAVARCLEKTEAVALLDGNTYTKQELCLQALQEDPSLAFAHSELGRTLTSGSSTIALPDNRVMTKQELYLEALRLHEHAAFYYNIATTLAPGRTAAPSTITLPDNRVMTKQDLYLEALRLHEHESFYYNIATALARVPGSCVRLHDGRLLNERELYIEALRCNSDFGDAYYNLFVISALDETTVLADGRRLSVGDLLLESGRCNPTTVPGLNKEMRVYVPLPHCWSRRLHVVYGEEINLLFATLLMGLQRLEDAAALPPAHHSMLEDMLEYWTWGDTLYLTDNAQH